MTRALVEIKVSDQGPSILVESTASEGSPAFVDAAAGTDVVLKAEKTLATAFSSLAPTIDIIFSQLKAVVQRPKIATVELGVKFGAKGNIIIAGGEAEANCKITLTWDVPDVAAVAALSAKSGPNEGAIQQHDTIQNQRIAPPPSSST